MNAEKSFSKAVMILLWIVVVLLFAVVGTGCAYNRATEDGALARVGLSGTLVPESCPNAAAAPSIATINNRRPMALHLIKITPVEESNWEPLFR